VLDTPAREVASDNQNYRLCVLSDGGYVFEVFTNNSAGYGLIDYRLSAEEVIAYRQRGKRFLGALANRVRHDYWLGRSDST
jgi:hypothetical protein